MPSAAPLRRVLCLALGLAAGGSPASARAAEPPTSAPRFTVRRERDAAPLAFTPDGRTLVGRGGRRITLTDAATGEPRGAFEPKGYAWALAVSADGARLALGTNRGVVEVWDLATLRPLRELLVWVWNVNAVAFSPDGRTLASAGRNGQVILWDAETGRQDRLLGQETAGGDVNRLAFSPDGRYLAAAVDRTRLEVWDLRDGGLCGALPLGWDHRPEVAFSPDGRSVAGSRSGGVAVLDLRDGGPSRTVAVPDAVDPSERPDGTAFDAPVSRVTLDPRVTLSPDWSTAANGLEDGRVAVWDVESRTVRRLLKGTARPDVLGGGLGPVTFFPDGRTIAAGYGSGAVDLMGRRPRRGSLTTGADLAPSPAGPGPPLRRTARPVTLTGGRTSGPRGGESAMRNFAAAVLLLATVLPLADGGPDGGGQAPPADEADALAADAASPRTIERLVDALHRTGDGGTVDLRAAGELERIGGPAVEPLMRALWTDDDRRRAAAAYALGRIPAALPRLADGLDSPEANVRRGSAQALGTAGERVRGELERRLTRLPPEGRERLLGGPDAADRPLVSPYVRLWRDEPRRPPAGRSAAGPTPDEADPFPAAARDVGRLLPDLRRLRDAVSGVVRVARDGDREVRQEAVRALAGIGPAADGAVPFLAEILGRERQGLNRLDRHRLNRLKDAAGYALGRIGPAAEPAVPALIAAAREIQDGSATAPGLVLGLVEIAPGRDDVFDLLTESLRHPDASVRQNAAAALGKAGPRAVPPLAGALADGHVNTRAAAAGSLGRIGGPAAAAALPALRELAETTGGDGDAGAAREAIRQIARERRPPGS